MRWSLDDLTRALEAMRIRRGDTTTIEVKRASGGVPSMPETLCAFANMPDGGTIILGVDEGNGRFEVTGLTDLAAIESGIISQARQAVAPSPQLVPQQFTVNGKQLLVGTAARTGDSG